MKNKLSKSAFRTDRLLIGRSVLLTAVLCASLLCVSCSRYEPAALRGETEGLPESVPEAFNSVPAETEAPSEQEAETEAEPAEEPDTRTPVRAKAIYLASKPVGNPEKVDAFISVLDSTELNAVVIDIKDDYGKITADLEGLSTARELRSVEVCIEDLPAVLEKFRSHGVYCIARIVSMRDPHLAAVKPEWMLRNQDGSLYKDGSGYTWVNPYQEEYWDYLLEIALPAGEAGFQEIQFDYIRFCTDAGADDCLTDESLIRGRDKITVITELVRYLYSRLREAGLYMSCDVFGTIIRSKVDSRAVGQDYAALASIIDYICPMVYPSHYSSGSFGLDHPDLYPYEAILGALKRSRSALAPTEAEGHTAIVRPWLQAFTATWLGSGNYRSYDAEAIREEIHAVYDAGYDEWILWSPSVSYDYSGMLSTAEAAEEDERIAESRAALPEETAGLAAETFPEELQSVLDGDELRPEDESILLEDGPIIVWEQGSQ